VSLNATIASRTGTVDILDDDPVNGVDGGGGDVNVVEGNSGYAVIRTTS
jgi:hypothetical protein